MLTFGCRSLVPQRQAQVTSRLMTASRWHGQRRFLQSSVICQSSEKEKGSLTDSTEQKRWFWQSYKPSAEEHEELKAKYGDYWLTSQYKKKKLPIWQKSFYQLVALVIAYTGFVAQNSYYAEKGQVHPITAYIGSKIYTEDELKRQRLKAWARELENIENRRTTEKIGTASPYPKTRTTSDYNAVPPAWTKESAFLPDDGATK